MHAAWSRPGWASAGTLPGDITFRVVTLAQGAFVVALAAVAWRLYRRSPEPRTVMRGLGGPSVAMLACALGGVMTGGVAQRVADWLDGPGSPGMGRSAVIDGPPVLLSWQASVIPVLLVLLLLPGVALGVRTYLAARRLEPLVDAEYEERRPDSARTKQIARTRATAALTDSAPGIVGLVSGATLLLGAGAVGGAWASGQVPGLAMDGSSPFVESVAEAAQSTGSWMIGFGFLVFVACGRRLPGRLRPAHHRHPLGRRNVLAARRPPLRTALLRGARRPRPGLTHVRLDGTDPRPASSSPATPRAASWPRPRSGSCPPGPGAGSPC